MRRFFMGNHVFSWNEKVRFKYPQKGEEFMLKKAARKILSLVLAAGVGFSGGISNLYASAQDRTPSDNSMLCIRVCRVFLHIAYKLRQKRVLIVKPDDSACANHGNNVPFPRAEALLQRVTGSRFRPAVEEMYFARSPRRHSMWLTSPAPPIAALAR